MAAEHIKTSHSPSDSTSTQSRRTSVEAEHQDPGKKNTSTHPTFLVVSASTARHNFEKTMLSGRSSCVASHRARGFRVSGGEDSAVFAVASSPSMINGSCQCPPTVLKSLPRPDLVHAGTSSPLALCNTLEWHAARDCDATPANSGLPAAADATCKCLARIFFLISRRLDGYTVTAREQA